MLESTRKVSGSQRKRGPILDPLESEETNMLLFTLTLFILAAMTSINCLLSYVLIRLQFLLVCTIFMAVVSSFIMIILILDIIDFVKYRNAVYTDIQQVQLYLLVVLAIQLVLLFVLLYGVITKKDRQ